MYGRESRQVPEQWIEKFAEEKAMDATSHTAKTIQILANPWKIAGSRKTEEVSRFSRVPITRLPFVAFEVGDNFYRIIQPAPTYRHFTEMGISNKERERARQEVNPDVRTEGNAGKTGERVLSGNFQYKWIGPYEVTKKCSHVLYEAIIDNEPTIVHTINIKHDQSIKNILPFVNQNESEY